MKNYSQAQLGEQLAISAQAVGKWERGESMPDILMLGRLAGILGVDLNYFGGGAETPSVLPDAPQPAADANDPCPSPKQGWNMSSGNWADADFSGLHGLAERLSRANIERCKFIGSELSGLILKGNNIERCDFTRSGLRACKFSSANLAHVMFVNCDLGESMFSRSDLKDCDFSGADLTGVVSRWSNFQKVKLVGAVLSGTVFRFAQLSDITFDGEIKDCAFEHCDFARVEFQNAVIRNTFFKNSKLKRAKFTNCKADKLSYAFMKASKADLTGVELLEER